MWNNPTLAYLQALMGNAKDPGSVSDLTNPIADELSTSPLEAATATPSAPPQPTLPLPQTGTPPVTGPTVPSLPYPAPGATPPSQPGMENNKWYQLAKALAPVAGALIGGPYVGGGMIQAQRYAEDQRMKQAELESEIQRRRDLTEVARQQQQVMMEQIKSQNAQREAVRSAQIRDDAAKLVDAINRRWIENPLTRPKNAAEAGRLALLEAGAMGLPVEARMPIQTLIQTRFASLPPPQKVYVFPNGEFKYENQLGNTPIPDGTAIFDPATQSEGLKAEIIRRRELSARKADQYNTPQPVTVPGRPGFIDATWDDSRGVWLDVDTKEVLKGAKRVDRPNQPAPRPQEEEDALNILAQALASKDPKQLVRLRDVVPMRGTARLIAYARAKKINPNFSPAEADRMMRMVDWAYTGKGAEQLRSFNTFLDHSGEVAKIVDNIWLSDSRIANKGLNWLRKNVTGNPELTDLLTAIEPVQKEFQSFLLNNRALYEMDRVSAQEILNDDSPPDVIKRALQRMGHTALARAYELNQSYKKVVKEDIEDILSPDAIEASRLIGLDVSKLTGETGELSAAEKEAAEYRAKKRKQK